MGGFWTGGCLAEVFLVVGFPEGFFLARVVLPAFFSAVGFSPVVVVFSEVFFSAGFFPVVVVFLAGFF